jgi:hypothetical protein
VETGSNPSARAEDTARTPTDAKRRPMRGVTAHGVANGKAEPFSLDRLPG